MNPLQDYRDKLTAAKDQITTLYPEVTPSQQEILEQHRNNIQAMLDEIEDWEL